MTPRHHQLIRFMALAVAVFSIVYMAQQAGSRVDVTEEGLSRLTEGTEDLIRSIAPDRPVTVHAFISDDVPGDYATVRSRLLNVLYEMEAEGGAGLTVRIVAPEQYSSEAEEASENFGIVPRTLVDRDGGRVGQLEVFMGLAFVSGPREEVIPFMDRGLSVEYELTRALQVVTQDKKKVVGILRTDASIMGRFDMQTMRQIRPWRIVGELKKQYTVRGLDPDKEIPEDIDALFIPQLSSLTQKQLDHVRTYVDAGRPALITADPMPYFNVRVAPTEPKLPPPGRQNNMFGGGAPQGDPKGDYNRLLRDFGVEWADERILFDTYQPHRIFEGLPEHIVFVGERPDGSNPFDDADPIVDGLTEVIVLFGGELQPALDQEAEFTPLLKTGTSAGSNMFREMVDKHPLFGLQGPIPPRRRAAISNQTHVMAARVRRAGESSEEGESKPPRNLIVVADLDLFGDVIYTLYERGGDMDGDGSEDVRFDNVTFLLNAMDSLLGDERFIALRKRKPGFRRLTTVDELTREARKKRDEEIDKANDKADKELDEAKAALTQAVAEISGRTGLDETTKAIMIESAEVAENRRLEAKQKQIEQQKDRAIARTETEHKRHVGEIQDRIRLVAVLLPPVPVLLLGALIFARKRRRERESIPQSRKRSARR